MAAISKIIILKYCSILATLYKYLILGIKCRKWTKEICKKCQWTAPEIPKLLFGNETYVSKILCYPFKKLHPL
jgi:hypothetical protein